MARYDAAPLLPEAIVVLRDVGLAMPVTQVALLMSLSDFLDRRLIGTEQGLRHISTVTEFVKAYTRAQGFDSTGLIVNDDLAASSSPHQSVSLPPSHDEKQDCRPDFILSCCPSTAFTVAERMVLNRYCQRTG